MRQLAAFLAIACLVGLFVELSGCSNDGDTPLVKVPPGFNPLTGEAPTPTPTSAAIIPPPATFIPAPTSAPNTYTTKIGHVLALTCPPDPAKCSDFGCQDDAQAYFQALAAATGKTDCAVLDGNGDGLACNGVGLPQHCP